MVKKAKARPKKSVAPPAGRVRKLDKKQARAKLKKAAAKQTPVPNSFRLAGQVFDELKRHWKPLGGIFLVYLVLNILFANGFISDVNNSVGDIRQNIGAGHSFSKALDGYSSLLGSGASGSQSSSAVQSVLLIIESLAIIWALRHLLADEKIGVKQAFYQSMTPLIPFILVVFVIIIQLLPLTLGSLLLGLVLSSAFTGGTFLTFIFTVLLALLAAWSLYMISGSIFALYIVTLPDMQPRQALRSAKNLVRFRRWPILRRLLFLPVVILLLMGIIMVPAILVVPALTTAVFFTLSMLAILVVHTYLYNLYRRLIA